MSFRRPRWFGQEVLWLDPEPAEPFRLLTHRVRQTFPDHPPYQGAYGDPVPHLTVAERRLAPDDDTLRRVESEVTSGLPFSAVVAQVLWIAGTAAPDSWRVLESLPLGPAPRAGGHE